MTDFSFQGLSHKMPQNILLFSLSSEIWKSKITGFSRGLASCLAGGILLLGHPLCVSESLSPVISASATLDQSPRSP